MAEFVGKSLEEELAREAAAMKALHGAVSAGLQHLLPYLHDEDPLPVAAALGNFPEHASWLLPAIDAAMGSTSYEQLRETLAESRSRLMDR